MAVDAGVKVTTLLFLLVALPIVLSITITTHDKPHEDSALPSNGNSSTIDDEISTSKPTINKQESPLQSSLIIANADNRQASTKLDDEDDKEGSSNRRESKMANPDYKRRRNDRQKIITSSEKNTMLLDQKNIETKKETTIKTNDVNSTDEDLILQERQRRLIPYQTYYKLQQSNPSLLQHNSIQPTQTYRTVPYEVVKQNAVFTPFTDSNKLPGGFTPMTKNSLIDQQYRQLVQLTANNGQTGNNNYNTILVQKLVQPTAVPYIKHYDDVRLANQNYGKLPQNVQFVQKFVQPSQVKPQYVNYYARPVTYSRRPTQNNYVPVKSYEDLQAVLMNHRIKPIVVDVHMVKPKYRPAQITVYDSRYNRPNLVLDGGVRPVYKPIENAIPQYKPEPAIYKQVPVLVNKPTENTVLQYKPEPKPVNVPTALLNYAYKIASPQLSNNGPVQFDYKPVKGNAEDDKSFEQIQAPLIKQSHEIIYPQQIKPYQTYAINKPSSLPQVQTTYSTPSVLDQQKTYVDTIPSNRQKPYAVLSPVQQQALLPLKNANSLTYLLKTLQKSNTLPQTFTPDNIDNSIKTLVNILNALKYHQKEQHQPVVYRPPNEEHENEAGVGLGGHIVVPDDDDSNEGGEEDDDGTVSERFPANTPEGGTPGKPGVDYPALSFIPETAFSCKTQRYKGFFGDPETNCQVWHYCDLNGGQASFLCPNGTIFSQVALTCDWWYNVKCASTPQLYVLNERLYKYILPFSPKFPEDYSGPLVDRYLTMKFKEMEEKMAREKKGKGTTEATTEKSNEDDDDEEEEGDIDDGTSVRLTTTKSIRGK